MMSSYPLSFDDAPDEISISFDGTPANAFDAYPYGAAGRIVKKATLAEIEAEGFDVSEAGNLDQTLYLFEFKDGRPSEYVWRSNLYLVPLEEP